MGCLLWILWLGAAPFAFLNWITFFSVARSPAGPPVQEVVVVKKFQVGDIVRTPSDGRAKMVSFQTRSHITGDPLWHLVWFEPQNRWEVQKEQYACARDMILLARAQEK